MQRGFDRSPKSINQAAALEAIEASGLGLDGISINKGTKFLDGGRAVIKVNNRIFGFFFSVSWNIQLEQLPIYTIDDYMPYELAPKRVRITGSLGSYVVPGESPQHHKFASDMMTYLFDRYISIRIEDSNTRSVIFETDQAIITRCGGEIQTGKPATLALEWEAISWRDDYDPLNQSIDWINEKSMDDAKLESADKLKGK
jgi:hypothetical protein